MSTIIGIDAGNRGAVGLLSADGSAVIDIAALPLVADGPDSRPAINAVLLATLLRRWAPTAAYCEKIAVFPTDGRVGAFAFGRCRGILEGALAALSIPTRWLAVPVWRRSVGLPANATKDQARGEAIRRWPASSEWFARPRDHDRAEACLVGLAGLKRESGQ